MSALSIPPSSYRFAGHQTFPLRLAWLPKAIATIRSGDDPLSDIDVGITKLGLGKNMVEALRCWIEAFQIAEKHEGNWRLTTLGNLIFDPKKGLDPYLEDHSTAWLLHWLISTEPKAPFFAWECLFNRWSAPDFSSSQVLMSFSEESNKSARPVSTVTLKQHWDVFIHSYRPPKTRNGEDHLECVLSQLGLVVETGERLDVNGKAEIRYEFDFSIKHSISQQLFSFVLHDWWNRYFPHEETVRVAELVAGNKGPGRVLKMSEREILSRLDELSSISTPAFDLTESASLRMLRRFKRSDGHDDLVAAYTQPRYFRSF